MTRGARLGLGRWRLSALRGSALTALAYGLLTATSAGGTPAQAKLFDLHGAILAGGMTGRGTNSGAPDLFHQTEGGAFAAELGARLLVVDFSIRFQQMVNSGGTGGTLLTALFGPSLEIPVKGGGQDAQGRQRPPEVVLHPSLVAGLVFGTLVPVDPPLTNAQLAGKGFLTMGRFGVERMFGPILGVGAEIEGGYHYLLGASGVANGKDHSAGWQLGAFATVAFHLGV